MRSKALALSFLLLAAAGAATAQQTINFPNFCNTSAFSLNGSTATLNPNAQCVLRLNQDFGVGSAFLTNTFSLAADASFSTFFSFQILNPVGIGDADGPGADGLVFAVQTVSNTAGGGGGGIGYAGITNSVGVEFDTYNNGEPGGGNHVGIDLNGSVTSVTSLAIPGRFNDGAVWFAWVDYNGVTDLLEVRVSNTPARPAAATIFTTVDLPTVLGTTNAFVGFTSGTGAGGGTHEIVSWNLVGAFAPVGQTPTPGPTVTPTVPAPAAVVPTLSFPMMALLALALGGIALAFLTKRV
ncbi:MAG TPA: PEP-CTERM sorting domain-containing protein [Thermoanaerobaculia bacterium]|nr:PEP-CTERM sorting domain-containing protein [Thermoanaerobaculia bacterium]